MANNFLTLIIDGLFDADSQRANAGDVIEISKRNDKTISHQAHSPSLHSYVLLTEFPLFDGL
jgi:hypothetical protein